MNDRLLRSVRRTIAALPSARTLTRLNSNTALGWLGLTRRRSRFPSQAAVAVAGALVGAAAAFLAAPSSGPALRSRLGKNAGGALGGSLGKLLGKRAGAHPVQAAKTLGTAREVFAPKEH